MLTQDCHFHHHVLLLPAKQDFGAIRVSTLTLVDLAGSERIAKTGAEGQRMKEVRLRACKGHGRFSRQWCAAATQAARQPTSALPPAAPCCPPAQGAAINKSLLTLGTVINKLSEGVQAAGAGSSIAMCRLGIIAQQLRPWLAASALNRTASVLLICPLAATEPKCCRNCSSLAVQAATSRTATPS